MAHHDGKSEKSHRKSGQKSARSTPVMAEQTAEIQRYGDLIPMRHGIHPGVCEKSVAALNQVLADTITLRDLYKKHHWQTSGPMFYQLHLLFDKHFAEQATLVDEVAERIQLLGGIGVAMAADVAELSRIQRPPAGRETAAVQITRLLDAHELILLDARASAEKADKAGDSGTADLLVSGVVRTGELQAWFLAEHLVHLASAV